MIKMTKRVIISAAGQKDVCRSQKKTLDNLIRERERTIVNLVKPLAIKPRDLRIERDFTPTSIALSVRDAIKYPSGHRNQRFNTICSEVSASYFEVWHKDFSEDGDEYFYLYMAYLQFYIPNKEENTEPEFFLLHSDPNEPGSGKHATYKQSLHLHIECNDAERPHGVWPRCHIALNVGMVDQVLKDADSFTEALKVTIEMLKNQVLESRYWKS